MYDGVIMMKDESPLWRKALSRFLTGLFPSTSNANSKDAQTERGVWLMLPDLIGELERGTGLDELISRISEVEKRQSDHLSGYPMVYHYSIYDTREKEKSAQRVLRKVRIKLVTLKVWFCEWFGNLMNDVHLETRFNILPGEEFILFYECEFYGCQ